MYFAASHCNATELLSCQNGFYLQDQQCIPCTEKFGQGVMLCTAQMILNCEYGFVLDGKSCADASTDWFSNDYSNCEDDWFWTDSYGDPCDWYSRNVDSCGLYGEGAFDACCACGGGTGESSPAEVSTADEILTCDPGFVLENGICVEEIHCDDGFFLYDTIC